MLLKDNHKCITEWWKQKRYVQLTSVIDHKDLCYFLKVAFSVDQQNVADAAMKRSKNIDVRYNLNDSWEQYDKWKKPVTETA